MRTPSPTQQRGRHGAAFFFALVLFPLIGTLSAASDPNTGNRVWVSDHKILRAVDTATNQATATIALKHKADALAIDPSDRVLWTLSNGEIFKFNEQGSAILGIDVKSLGVRGNPGILKLNPYDGSVWTGSQRALLRLNADGTNRLALQIADSLRDVGLDIDESVWVLTKHALLHLSPDGAVLKNVDLKPLNIKPRRFAVDSLGGWVWISTRTYLFKFQVSDLTAVPQSIRIPGTNDSDDDDEDEKDEDPKAVAVATHPVFGTLFVATKDALLLYDRAGSLVKNIDLRPFALNPMRGLAYDAASGGVWLGGHKVLLRFATNGDFLASVALDKKADAIGVTPFRLRPTVTPIAPPDNSLTNSSRPLVRLGLGASCNGAPCTLADAYIQSLTLDVTLNGIQVGPLFSIVSPEAQFLPSSPLPDGTNSLLSKATDLFGHSSDVFVTRFVIDTVAPQFAELEPQDGTVFTTPQATIKGRLDDLTANVALLDQAGEGLGLQGASFSFAVTLKEGTNSFTLVATDAANNSTSRPLELVLNTLPPDPVTVAPPVDRGVATILSASTAFLYSGPNPIQRGVAPDTIEPKRAAVVRGRVLTRDNNPLSGVRITILNHPEFGHTLSRADGAFDLAVNGGGVLTVNFTKAGYLPAQRQVNAPWQDYVHVPEVVLIPLDTQVTHIQTNAAAMQVARGSISTDADGTRRATLLFPAGTTATMTLPDGTTQALSMLSVRATEYTIGANGPETMPATLPPTSGYTYAVELSVDEAIAAGAKSVAFSLPVVQYVENFLQFPVGGIVPAGYYDRDKAAWIPSDNGKVIKILSIAGGLAVLDINGDDSADTAADLATFGVSDAERATLANLYTVGTSLWRIPVSHFSAWDYNWPYLCVGLDLGICPDPNQPPPLLKSPEQDPCIVSGSTIECQNQTLGEEVAVVGTPFVLHYRSDRVPGRRVADAITIPLSGDTLPGGVIGIELIIDVAGQRLHQRFPAAPRQRYTFTWDGRDAYGRAPNGSQRLAIQIGYIYRAVPATPAQIQRSFAAPSSASTGISLSGGRVVATLTVWQQWLDLTLGDAREPGLGGWSFDSQHLYDPLGKILHFGSGGRRYGTGRQNTVITTAAGTGVPGDSGDGGPAAAAMLNGARDVEIGSDGRVYIADYGNHRIRRIALDGTITTIAGTGTAGHSGDGGPATQARLFNPRDVTVAPDGTLYIADQNNHRVRRVSPEGIIMTVAGTGVAGFSGDGGPATQAQLQLPRMVTVAPDGTLYIADGNNHRIRRVTPDGAITTIAGTGVAGFSGDGGPATQARLNLPHGIVLSPAGVLYIADYGNHRIRRVTPDGIITTAAGIGVAGFSGDGGPAAAARLFNPYALALATDGGLYITDLNNHRVRVIAPDGTITTIAGTGAGGFSGDGGPAAQARLAVPHGLAAGADGTLYVMDLDNQRLRRIAAAFPDFAVGELVLAAPTEEAVYVFSAAGRHLRTVESHSGATRYTFGHDARGYLTSITDADANQTRIERGADGHPTAILAPDGQRTTLTLNTDGYLASITNPAGDTHAMTYTADGLLTTFTTPRGHTARMTYDTLGRLTRDENPAGGSWTLTRNNFNGGYTASMTSALNRTTSYRVEALSTGDRHWLNTNPDGTTTQSLFKIDGTTTITAADGTTTTSVEGPDPRFGMQAPIEKTRTTRLPSGLAQQITRTRSATLPDPNDLLSLQTQTDTVTVNGKTATNLYTAATQQHVTTSPTGRSTRTTIDAKGRPTQIETPGLNPIAYGYDTRGRLTNLSQGSGTETRTATLAYNPQGFLDSITDALGRVQAFTYDPAGRVTQQTLPDGRLITWSYDANGNVIGITPPGRPQHNFAYTPVDLEQQYTPPAVTAAVKIVVA